MRCCTLLFLLAVAVPIGHARPTPGWTDDVPIVVPGANGAPALTRYVRYYVPQRLAAQPAPAVFFLHGGGSSMRRAMPPAPTGSAEWPAIAEAEGFILIVPNGWDPNGGGAFGDRQSWNDCRPGIQSGVSTVDDAGFIAHLMDWSVDALGVDPRRRYLSGASNGGLMAYRMAIEHPQRVAAASAFIANLSAETECVAAATAAPMPMQIVVGTADGLMPYAGGEIGLSGTLAISAEATRDVWLERNRLSGPPQRATLPDLDGSDGSTVERELWAAPDGSTAVEFIRLVGAGHAMPSRVRRLPPSAIALVGVPNADIEGTVEAWRFLSRFPTTAPAFALTDAYAGVFFDPARSGEGVQLHFGMLDGVRVLLLAVYTYDTIGNPMWLVGAAPVDAGSAGPHVVAVDRARGARFGTAFDPAEVVREHWGTIAVRFLDCDHIALAFDSVLPGFAATPARWTRVAPRGSDVTCP